MYTTCHWMPPERPTISISFWYELKYFTSSSLSIIIIDRTMFIQIHSTATNGITWWYRMDDLPIHTRLLWSHPASFSFACLLSYNFHGYEQTVCIAMRVQFSPIVFVLFGCAKLLFRFRVGEPYVKTGEEKWKKNLHSQVIPLKHLWLWVSRAVFAQIIDHARPMRTEFPTVAGICTSVFLSFVECKWNKKQKLRKAHTFYVLLPPHYCHWPELIGNI